MLTFEQLQAYYPEAKRLSRKSIIVEYLQYELLDSIFKHKSSAHLSFIGGTAIRIVHHSQRWSEDLDFDNFGLSFQEFTELTKFIISDMELKGFNVEFRLVEKGAYHCYIRFPRILYLHNISGHRNEKILVRIDTVNKEKIFNPVVHILNKFDIYRTILTHTLDILLAQKLITILQRKREKGRDFFDVSYLYGMTEPNFDYVTQCTGLAKEDFIKSLLERCQTFDYRALANDIQPLLIKPEQANRVLGFKQFIQSKLSSHHSL